jgi:hypothetical protein
MRAKRFAVITLAVGAPDGFDAVVAVRGRGFQLAWKRQRLRHLDDLHRRGSLGQTMRFHGIASSGISGGRRWACARRHQ